MKKVLLYLVSALLLLAAVGFLYVWWMQKNSVYAAMGVLFGLANCLWLTNGPTLLGR